MRILVISAANISYDGRLREIIEVFQKIGKTTILSCSDDTNRYKESKVYNCRTKSYLSFIQFVVKMTKNLGSFDIVVADNRKALLPACLSKRYTKPKLFMNDSRELYVFRDVKHFEGKVGCLLETLLQHRFDLIVVANKERADLMKQMYRLKQTPLVFLNLRDFSDFSLDSSLAEAWDSVFEKYKYNIISVAGCSFERLTDHFVNAIGKRNDCSLYLIGDNQSSDYVKMKQLIEKQSFSNIYIIEMLKPEQLNYFMSKAQLGIVSYHKNDFNNMYCASGKIYEYVMAGIPMLSSTNIPLVNFCEEYGVGVASDDIDKGLEHLLENYEKYVNNVRNAQKKISIEENRRKLSLEILNFYKNL